MRSLACLSDHARRGKTGGVFVRPVSPGDEDGLREMLSRLSRRSIHLRFHAPYPRVPEWAVAAFAQADRKDGESLVAAAEDEIVGHAMYVRSERGDEAEFAVVVEDRWQGCGVGKHLLSEITRRAGARGVNVLTGSVLGENRRMLGLARSVFSDVGYAVRDGAYELRARVGAFEPAPGVASSDAA